MEYGEHQGIQAEALEDLSDHLGFAFCLDDGKIANDGAEASGILLNKPASGEAANVGVQGDLPFQAGGAVAKGAKLTVTTSGYVITCGSGFHVVGTAMRAVTSGSVGRGIFNFANAVYAQTSDYVA